MTPKLVHAFREEEAVLAVNVILSWKSSERRRRSSTVFARARCQATVGFASAAVNQLDHFAHSTSNMHATAHE